MTSINLSNILESIKSTELPKDKVLIINFRAIDRATIIRAQNDFNNTRYSLFDGIYHRLKANDFKIESFSDKLSESEFEVQGLDYLIGRNSTTSIDAWRIISPGQGYVLRDVAQYLTSNRQSAETLVQRLNETPSLTNIFYDVNFGQTKKPEVKHVVDLLWAFHQHELHYEFERPNMSLPRIDNPAYLRKLDIVNRFLQENRERMINEYGLHIAVRFDAKCHGFYSNGLPNGVQVVPYTMVEINIGKGAFDDLSDVAFEGMLYHSLANAVHAQRLYEQYFDFGKVEEMRFRTGLKDKLNQFDHIAIEVFGKRPEVQAYRTEVQARNLRRMGARSN